MFHAIISHYMTLIDQCPVYRSLSSRLCLRLYKICCQVSLGICGENSQGTREVAMWLHDTPSLFCWLIITALPNPKMADVQVFTNPSTIGWQNIVSRTSPVELKDDVTLLPQRRDATSVPETVDSVSLPVFERGGQLDEDQNRNPSITWETNSAQHKLGRTIETPLNENGIQLLERFSETLIESGGVTWRPENDTITLLSAVYKNTSFQPSHGDVSSFTVINNSSPAFI